jgi:hypothetical protein
MTRRPLGVRIEAVLHTEFGRMKRFAIAILWLAAVVGLSTPGTFAQQVGKLAHTGFREVDSSNYYLLQTAAPTGRAIRAAFDEPTPTPWDEEVSITDQMYSETEPGLALTPSTCEPQRDGCEECCCTPCERACPNFYGQVEAVFLWRESRLIDQPIVVDPNTGITYLSTSDLNSGFYSGVRATVGARICGGRALEFTYLGLCPGDSTDVAVSPDPGAFLIFPDNFVGNVFVGLDRLQADYSSRLNSLEANLPCCCGCCDESCPDCCDECGDECGCPEIRCQSYEWFAGFRYIRVSEDLNLIAQRTVGGAVEEGNYEVHTSNNLYGLQLGARTRRTQGRYGWETTGKVGIFGNDARQRQSVTDFPDFPLRPNTSSSSGGVAFVGEANLTYLYRLTQVWNLRAGYGLMWIEGLALAPDQLDFDFGSATGGSQLHNGGAIFLHGVNVGIEARW